MFRTLATEPIEQRRHNPGLEPGRVDVIVGGAIVVVSVHAALGHSTELLVSEADILDGLARNTRITTRVTFGHQRFTRPPRRAEDMRMWTSWSSGRRSVS